MNKARRAKLKEIVENMQSAVSELEELVNEEQDSFDNMPEAFRDGSEGEAKQEGLDDLNEFLDEVRNALEVFEGTAAVYA